MVVRSFPLLFSPRTPFFFFPFGLNRVRHADGYHIVLFFSPSLSPPPLADDIQKKKGVTMSLMSLSFPLLLFRGPPFFFFNPARLSSKAGI